MIPPYCAVFTLSEQVTNKTTNMKNALTVRYNFIQIAYYAPCYPDDLKKAKPIVIENAGHIAKIYDCLNRVNKPSRFLSPDAHLLIEAEGAVPQYLMDGQGNIKRDKNEYQITPRAFLDLVTLLEEYAIKNLQKNTGVL